jgi:hypothetical protein
MRARTVAFMPMLDNFTSCQTPGMMPCASPMPLALALTFLLVLISSPATSDGAGRQ